MDAAGRPDVHEAARLCAASRGGRRHGEEGDREGPGGGAVNVSDVGAGDVPRGHRASSIATVTSRRRAPNADRRFAYADRLFAWVSRFFALVVIGITLIVAWML